MMLTIFALVAATVVGQAPVPPPPSWSPVLDCGQRIYAIEGLICEDPALLAGARRMETAYALALVDLPSAQAAQLAEAQLEWSKQRNQCAFKRKAAACVDRLQDKRTRAIERR